MDTGGVGLLSQKEHQTEMEQLLLWGEMILVVWGGVIIVHVAIDAVTNWYVQQISGQAKLMPVLMFIVVAAMLKVIYTYCAYWYCWL